MEIILTIILAILVISPIAISVGIAIYYYKNSNKMKESLSKISSMNNYKFDSDMEFLFHLIDYKCTVYINLTLKPLSSIKDNKLLTDEDLDNAVENIVADIYEILSDSYKNNIYKYFTVEGFRIYLVEIVLNTLTVFISKDNSVKIRSMNKKNLTDINEEDNNKDKLLVRATDVD